MQFNVTRLAVLTHFGQVNPIVGPSYGFRYAVLSHSPPRVYVPDVQCIVICYVIPGASLLRYRLATLSYVTRSIKSPSQHSRYTVVSHSRPLAMKSYLTRRRQLI